MIASPHFAIVRMIVASTMHVAPDEITPDSSNHTVAGWDSLANVALIARLADCFEVTFSNDELLEMTSVPSILMLLDRKIRPT